MESVLGRYRNLIILVGVLFLQVLGLAMQMKRGSDTQDTRLIRIWAVGALSPFERSLVWVRNGTGNIFHNYIYLRGVRAENRELKQQIEQMRLQQVRLSEDAAQAHRLQSLLAFKEQVLAIGHLADGAYGQTFGKNFVSTAGQHNISGSNLLVAHDALEHDFPGGSTSQDPLQPGFVQNRTHAAGLIVDQQHLRHRGINDQDLADNSIRRHDGHVATDTDILALVDVHDPG